MKLRRLEKVWVSICWVARSAVKRILEKIENSGALLERLVDY